MAVVNIKIPEMVLGDFGTVEEMEERWNARAGPGTQVKVVPAGEKGPETIECIYDVAMCTPWLLEEIRKAEGEGFDAVIIPCMADPGLYAAREISNIPVVGESEVSWLLAIALGHRFSIIQPLKEGLGRTRQMLRVYGFERFVASVRVLGLSVQEMAADRSRMKDAAMREGRKAVEEDGADVIAMGCGLMADLAKDMEEQLGVPVIEPSAASIRFAEMLVTLGLSHSKRAYMPPPRKRRQI